MKTMMTLPSLPTQEWPSERNRFQSLKPTMMSKLPAVVCNTITIKKLKLKNNDKIISFVDLKTFKSDKVPDYESIAPSTVTKLPKLKIKRKKVVDIDMIDLKVSKTKRLPTKDISDPLKDLQHIVVIDHTQSKQKQILNFDDASKSHYHYPRKPTPYCHGPVPQSDHDSFPKPCTSWRSIQRTMLNWQSKYNPRQIHSNFVNTDNNTKFYMDMLNKRVPKKPKYPITFQTIESYRYPIRHLPNEERIPEPISTNCKPDEASLRLDLLLQLSNVRYQEQQHLSRLNTAVQVEEQRLNHSRDKQDRKSNNMFFDCHSNIVAKIERIATPKSRSMLKRESLNTFLKEMTLK
ncbi:hypothetical protein BC833DRAFT_611173 [Globomyces pollinis-pini]|nr:hypothetical protein BC833DRAFT_611173 [Globomyces pollinis-pini]